MDIIVAIMAVIITVAILGNSKIDKSSSQLMLLGLEITIIGAVFILVAVSLNSNSALYLVGLALTVIGFTINLFGFGKK